MSPPRPARSPTARPPDHGRLRLRNFAVAKGPGRKGAGRERREGVGRRGGGGPGRGLPEQVRLPEHALPRSTPQPGQGRGRSPGGEGANKQRAPRLADTHGFMSQKRGGTACAVAGAGAENDPATRPDLLRQVHGPSGWKRITRREGGTDGLRGWELLESVLLKV